jgi:AcrR family transcriptional regulator
VSGQSGEKRVRSKSSPRKAKKSSARRNSKEIRQQLIKAAGAEFRQYGFAGATTAAIARNAGTTEMQLYRAFQSKARLFREAVFEPLNEHLKSFLEGHLAELQQNREARGQARRYIDELQQFIDQNSKLLLSLVAAQTFGADDVGRHGIDNLQAYFKVGASMMRRRVGRRAVVDPDVLVRISFAAVLGCVIFKDWMFPRGSSPDSVISAAIADFVIDGINVNADPGMSRSSGGS